MGDFVLSAQASYLLAGKVYSVNEDDSVKESEAAHYVLPEELDNLLPSDFVK